MATKKKSAMDAVKAKMSAMQQKKGSGGAGFMRIAPDSKVVVRIFSEPRDAEEFWVEREVYRLGKGLPVAWDGKGENPIAKIHEERRKKALDLQKKDKAKGQALLKKDVDPLRPTSRFFFQAAVLTKDGPVSTQDKDAGKPLTKAEIWDAGPQVTEQIFALFAEEDAEVCGDFREKGNEYDFVVKRTGEGLKTEYSVMPTRKYTKVDTSEVEVREDLAADLPAPVSGKALLALLNGEEAEEEDEDDDIDDSNVGSSKKKAKPADDEDEDSDDDEDSEDDDESDDDESDDDEDSDDEDEDEDEDDEDESDEDSDEEDEDEDESDEDSDDEDEDESDDDESDDDESDDDESDEDEDSDEDESDDEDEDEDSDEDESDDEDEDEDDNEKPKAKAKSKPASKKAVPKASPKKPVAKKSKAAGKKK
jgi:hypothetical protein